MVIRLQSIDIPIQVQFKINKPRLVRIGCSVSKSNNKINYLLMVGSIVDLNNDIGGVGSEGLCGKWWLGDILSLRRPDARHSCRLVAAAKVFSGMSNQGY